MAFSSESAFRTDDATTGLARSIRKPPKEFDHVAATRCRRTVTRRAKPEDIGLLLSCAAATIGITLATSAVIAKIAASHSDSLWTFARGGRVVGGFAVLMLNASGAEALLSDRIDFGNPPMRILATPMHPPAAIYVWAVFGPPLAADGIAAVIERLRSPLYAKADVFARPASAAGLRFMLGLGFTRIPGHPRNIHRYVRLANRPPLGEA